MGIFWNSPPLVNSRYSNTRERYWIFCDRKLGFSVTWRGPSPHISPNWQVSAALVTSRVTWSKIPSHVTSAAMMNCPSLPPERRQFRGLDQNGDWGKAHGFGNEGQMGVRRCIMGGARQAVACEGNKRGRKAERGLAVNLSIEHPLFSPHWDCNGHLKHHNGCTVLHSARLENSLWLAI